MCISVAGRVNWIGVYIYQGQNKLDRGVHIRPGQIQLTGENISQG